MVVIVAESETEVSDASGYWHSTDSVLLQTGSKQTLLAGCRSPRVWTAHGGIGGMGQATGPDSIDGHSGNPVAVHFTLLERGLELPPHY